jgi:enamine deaminase RidA (YjgF/YER057c/UK114 family)
VPINRRNIQPAALHQRRVDNLVLYSHVVSVEPRQLIFVSGQLARNKDGSAQCLKNANTGEACSPVSGLVGIWRRPWMLEPRTHPAE